MTYAYAIKILLSTLSCGAGAGHDVSGSFFPQRVDCQGLYDCISVARQIAEVPSGTGWCAKSMLWWVHRRSFCNIGGVVECYQRLISGQACLDLCSKFSLC